MIHLAILKYGSLIMSDNNYQSGYPFIHNLICCHFSPHLFNNNKFNNEIFFHRIDSFWNEPLYNNWN